MKTAKKAFNRLVRYFTDKEHPELSCLVEKIRRTNGEEAIYLTNGGSIEFSARTNGSARGFDDIQLVVFDEAQELTDSQYDAIMYTLAASATGERQIIYTGTPPNEYCPGTVFARTRAAILPAGDIPSTEWCSWATDECPRQDATFNNVVDLIYESNPSMGIICAATSHGVRRRVDHRLRPRAPGLVQPCRHAHEGHPAGIVGRRAHRRHRRPVPRQEGLRGEVLPGTGRPTRCRVASSASARSRARPPSSSSESERPPAAPASSPVGLYDRRATASVVVIDGMSGADALIDRLAEMKPPRGYVREAADARRGRRRGRLRGRAQRRHARAHLRPDPRGVGEEVRPQEDRVQGRMGLRLPEDATVPPEPLESCSLALWGARTTKRNPRRKQRTL